MQFIGPFLRFTFLIATGLVLLACGKDAPPKKAVVRPIKMLTIGDEDVSGRLEFPGRIRAAEEANLAFEVDGKLEQVFVSEGDRLKEGAKIAQLDARDYQAQLEEVLAGQKEAKARYDRSKELFAADSVSKQDLDVDRRSFEVANARLKTAQKAVEDTILRAPFDGIVAKRFVENYEQVRAKEKVVFFHAEAGLEVKIDVPERIMRRYGNPEGRSDDPEKTATQRFAPQVVVDGIVEPLPARFVEIATAADDVTQTFEIKLGFDTPEGELILPGMSAKVIIDVSAAAENAPLQVPAQAIVSTTDKQTAVWVVDKKTMQVTRRPIEAGSMSRDQIVVKSGLRSGETIALSGLDALLDGMKVAEYQLSAKK